MKYFWFLANLADLITTILIIRSGGVEVMPVWSWLIGISELLFALVKVGLTIGLYYLLNRFWFQKHPDTLRVANGAFGMVVLINGVSLWYLS